MATTNNATFSLSANLDNGLYCNSQYIVTPNVRKVLEEIVNTFSSGVHSFTIIGTYGTGKSSFLLNLEADLINRKRHGSLLDNPKVIYDGEFEVLNIIGDPKPLSIILSEHLQKRLNADSNDPLALLKAYESILSKQGKFLLVVIDEFGKVLEHAATHNTEEELYFFQKLTEFVNKPTRNMMLLTTLHQNFSAYSNRLTEIQKNEWTKVKGRFHEVVFAEPVEQLLYLAAEQLSSYMEPVQANVDFISLHELALNCNFVNQSFSKDTALRLSPLDSFSACVVTKAIQSYGQNERSLFSFLNIHGRNSVADFEISVNHSYSLCEVYDYIVGSFHSYLNDANKDSMAWSSMRMSLERVEGTNFENSETLVYAIKIVKAIGLLNLFGDGSFSMKIDDFVKYAYLAMGVKDAGFVVHELIRLKIVRYAEYRHRLILFEGTDINIEAEIQKASLVVPRPVNFVDDLRLYFNGRVSPANAHYYHRGTPRYFKYTLCSEPEDVVPTGDIDGYVQMVFSMSKNCYSDLVCFSKECEHAIIFAFFRNTEDIVSHLHNIKKYRHIVDNVLIDKSDRVAMKEIMQLMEYEKTLLNKIVQESLFSYSENVVWLYKGKVIKVNSQREFNKLLSFVCDDIYSLTPVICNELFNRHKLSSNISAAKVKYLQALLDGSGKENLGFEKDKFPPEKTIYYSLLKDTGLHIGGEFSERPSNETILTLWNVCEDFLRSTRDGKRKLSELMRILTSQPYKLKDGLIEIWLPTYLFIKRQDFYLYGENGQYIQDFTIELFDLMKKHMGSFQIKALALDGVRLALFNQYRQYLNLQAGDSVNTQSFIDTIKPFFYFYKNQLNDYARQTRKVDHQETIRFREVLAHAKDPEKTFLEEMPEALGYDYDRLRNESDVRTYCNTIQRSVRELRGAYNQLIDRIEAALVEGLGLSSYEYKEYIQEIRQRLSKVKPHLLSARQLEFYQHAAAEFSNRQEWYQSVCYSVLSRPLYRMNDAQEPKLLDDMIFLFRECEQQAVIAEGLNYKINDSEAQRSAELESKINSILSGNPNLDIYTLTRILQKRLQ